MVNQINSSRLCAQKVPSIFSDRLIRILIRIKLEILFEPPGPLHSHHVQENRYQSVVAQQTGQRKRSLVGRLDLLAAEQRENEAHSRLFHRSAAAG